MREITLIGPGVDGAHHLRGRPNRRTSSPSGSMTGCARQCAAIASVCSNRRETTRSKACYVPRTFSLVSGQAHPWRGRRVLRDGSLEGRTLRASGAVGAAARRRVGTAAHPVLADGPAVETLLETIASALSERGLSTEATSWDAWRTDDGRWTVRMSWTAGLSENFAHFRFTPGAQGDSHGDRRSCQRTDRPRVRAATAPSRRGSPAGVRAARTHPTPAPAPAASETPRQQPAAPARKAQAGGACLGRRAARRAHQRRPLAQHQRQHRRPASGHTAAAPRTNQRRTGRLRQSHNVGARPPTATRFSPMDTTGFTRLIPRLRTTIAVAMTAATKAATSQTGSPRRRVVSHRVRLSVGGADPLVEGQGGGGGDVERIGPA